MLLAGKHLEINLLKIASSYLLHKVASPTGFLWSIISSHFPIVVILKKKGLISEQPLKINATFDKAIESL